MNVAAALQTVSPYRALRWEGGVDGELVLIDQTLLPLETKLLTCRDVETVWEAIRSLRVRGAPAIGISAAYGLVIGVRAAASSGSEKFFSELDRIHDYLAGSRPTAVNLFWALGRMMGVATKLRDAASPSEILLRLLEEAQEIEEEDRRMCRAIGFHGASLLEDGMGVLTHCNAGGLATADYGTALAVFFAAAEQGKKLHVFADETRPLLQGARLTAWELMQWDVPVTLICDSMAAQVMREGRIQACVVGADRITANGDTANKIGTYGVACLASVHEIPFYVAAPSSTFDLARATGEEIPIEQRPEWEITHAFGRRTAPEGVPVYNPAFDVTPVKYIRALITEKGLIQPVTEANIRATIAGQ
ncbi:MAG TPA: S-methyl-5-thioribose-1-phosphate isomerase [Pirellulales bacterium]